MATVEMTLPKTIIYILNGPGAEKEALTKRFAQEVGLVHICVGNLLHSAIKDGSIGREQLKDMKDGKPAPPEFIQSLLRDSLAKAEGDAVLLDGFPRNLEQMYLFEASFNVKPTAVYFTINHDKIELRILERILTFTRCDTIYDDIGKVRKRFGQFEEETMPCVEELREQKRLFEFHRDGDFHGLFDDFVTGFADWKLKSGR